MEQSEMPRRIELSALVELCDQRGPSHRIIREASLRRRRQVEVDRSTRGIIMRDSTALSPIH
jgi:hypothetical protein